MNKYFSFLSNGVSAAAFHGLIQIGFGLEVEHEPSVLDGLAFLSSRYLPLGEVNRVIFILQILNNFLDIKVWKFTSDRNFR